MNRPPDEPLEVRAPRLRRYFVGLAALLVAAALGVHLLAGGPAPTSPAAASLAAGTAGPAGTRVHRASGTGPAGQPAALGAVAPNGTYTTVAGTTASVAALRGRPAMVWFVAGGCASCAASIPAVAAHLRAIRSAGVRVLTLGLFGDFAPGAKGVAELLSFGRAAADGPVPRPGWDWGMASAALSLAYDPSGTPDVYVLIGAHGHLRYRNSVPVSTMSALLAAARALDVHDRTTSALPPCC